MVEQRKTTTIQISIETRDKLDTIINSKRETYDQIIKRLIYVYETKQGELLEKEFMKGAKAANKHVKGTKIKE
jgi:hypothetical protein